MKLTSIRARLLLVYVGILCGGFIALTLVAGEQISSAARADYELRLKNEIQLIAQGITASLLDETTSVDAFNSLIENYEAHTGGTLTILPLERRGDRLRQPEQLTPEMETALRGQVVVVERQADSGQATLYTAATIGRASSDFQVGMVQLSVPLTNLQQLVWQRWLSLGAILLIVTALALGSALLLARSIIRPLSALQNSAARLAAGDLSHRVAYDREDEIGAVARTFNDMAQQVQSMLDEQRAFASNTSHELRTPLTTIRLRSEALRYDSSLDDGLTQQYIQEIDDEANRMGALIEDLTVLSRFDAGRAELGDNQIDTGHFAHNLCQRLLPQAQTRQIRLEVTAPDAAPPVRASLNHLTIVFRNLLDNAIKYTPEGGAVTWQISAEAGGIRSVIRDTGRGVEADQLAHIFERFYRADKSRSRDVPGSGLGLAIVKSIVEAYGGSVTAASAGSGTGLAVTVFWPYRPAPR